MDHHDRLQENEAAPSLANEERIARPTTTNTQSLHDTLLKDTRH